MSRIHLILLPFVVYISLNGFIAKDSVMLISLEEQQLLLLPFRDAAGEDDIAKFSKRLKGRRIEMEMEKYAGGKMEMAPKMGREDCELRWRKQR